MDIIDIPKDHALLQLWSQEIRVLWIVLSEARKSMDSETFLKHFNMTPEYADGLLRKLGDALELAKQHN